MGVEFTGPASYLDFDGLRQLRGAAHRGDGAAVAATAKQFEALFVQSLLKSMRESVEKSDLFSSESAAMYEGLYDKELSQILANRGIFGIGKLLATQMERRTAPVRGDGAAAPATGSPEPAGTTGAAPASAGLPLPGSGGLPLQRDRREYPLGNVQPPGMAIETMPAARAFGLRDRSTR